MKDFCKDCAWFKTKEKLKFCVDLQNSSATECDRWYVFGNFSDDGPKTCEHCDRDKDPGKCWWCEIVS